MKLWNKIVGVFLGLSMAVGIGVAINTVKKPLQANAASPATLTFTAKCGGTGVDSDGNTWTITSDAAESSFDTTKGVHYGTGSAAVSYLNLTTSAITGTITQIIVNASGASGTTAKLDITVGSSAFGSQQSLTSTATNYTLTGSASGAITVAITQSSAKKALYCKSISVTYGESPTPPGPTPTPTSDYVLTPASGSNSSYAGNCDIEIEGITWNLTGNSQMQPWRIGGKSITDTDRELYSKTALEKEIYKIEVTHGGASSITVNSWTVIVASDAEFEDVISTLTPTFVANDTTEIDRPSGVSWNNAYYKFIYNVTVSRSSNKFIEFTSATFYCEESSEDVEEWCESFLSTVTCDATGVTPPSKTAWSTMKTSFITLSDADKLTLKTLSNEATARYDYIVAKYGSSEYEDFIGRNPAPLLVRGWTINPLNETSVIPAIIIVSIAAITTIGVIIALKKKKVN